MHPPAARGLRPDDGRKLEGKPAGAWEATRGDPRGSGLNRRAGDHIDGSGVECRRPPRGERDWLWIDKPATAGIASGDGDGGGSCGDFGRSTLRGGLGSDGDLPAGDDDRLGGASPVPTALVNGAAPPTTPGGDSDAAGAPSVSARAAAAAARTPLACAEVMEPDTEPEAPDRR